jgi:hypothetical protein
MREHHPIWPLYDEIRTARLNAKVLGLDIRCLASRILWMDVILSVSTSSSIGGLWFFQSGGGVTIWKVLGAIAIICTALKPVLKYQEEKDVKESLRIGYNLFENQLMQIVREVQTREVYDDALKDDFRRVMSKKNELIETARKERVSRKQIIELQDEVDRELPSNSLYLPPYEHTQTNVTSAASIAT